MATTVKNALLTSQVKSASDSAQLLAPKLSNVKAVQITAGSTALAIAEMYVYFAANPNERLLFITVVTATTVFFTVPAP